MRTMRHADRVRSTEWAYEKLAETNMIFLAMNDDIPYCVPVSHIVWGENVYFHSANRGLKSELLKKDPRVCVTAVAKATPDIPGMTVQYQSVVAYGRAEVVTEVEEKVEALRRICHLHTPGNPDNDDCSVRGGHREDVVVYRIVIDQISGKERGPKVK